MRCPKCNRENFIIIDYEPLHTISGASIVNDSKGNKYIAEGDNYLDDELYCELKCTSCNHIVKARGKISFNLEL
jgi:CTP:phosphocholine cytidylyltransferase-like protein